MTGTSQDISQEDERAINRCHPRPPNHNTTIVCLGQSQPPDHFHIHSASIFVLWVMSCELLCTHFSGFAADRHFDLIFLSSVCSSFAFIFFHCVFFQHKHVQETQSSQQGKYGKMAVKLSLSSCLSLKLICTYHRVDPLNVVQTGSNKIGHCESSPIRPPSTNL